MSKDKKDEFEDILADELSEWDRMFDTVHSSAPSEVAGLAGLQDQPPTEEPFALEIAGEEEKVAEAEKPPGPSDTALFSSEQLDEAVLDSFGDEVTGVISEAELQSMSESAAAFFGDGDDKGAGESLFGDDDEFYDGIEIAANEGDPADVTAVRSDPLEAERDLFRETAVLDVGAAPDTANAAQPVADEDALDFPMDGPSEFLQEQKPTVAGGPDADAALSEFLQAQKPTVAGGPDADAALSEFLQAQKPTVAGGPDADEGLSEFLQGQQPTVAGGPAADASLSEFLQSQQQTVAGGPDADLNPVDLEPYGDPVDEFVFDQETRVGGAIPRETSTASVMEDDSAGEFEQGQQTMVGGPDAPRRAAALSDPAAQFKQGQSTELGAPEPPAPAGKAAHPEAVRTRAETSSSFLRAPGSRSESEDSYELEHEVEGAVESLLGGFDEAPMEDSVDIVLGEGDEASIVEEVVVREEITTSTMVSGPAMAAAEVEPEFPEDSRSFQLPRIGANSFAELAEVAVDGSDRSESLASELLWYESEEGDDAIEVHMEIAHLSAALGDLERAKSSLDEVLAMRPGHPEGCRALRRIAQQMGQWEEIVLQLRDELKAASDVEKEAIQKYRAWLLMAMGDRDMARVAVGEVCDLNADDIDANFAELELSYVDERGLEFRESLERLARSHAPAPVAGALRKMLAVKEFEDSETRVASMAEYTETPSVAQSVLCIASGAVAEQDRKLALDLVREASPQLHHALSMAMQENGPSLDDAEEFCGNEANFGHVGWLAFQTERNPSLARAAFENVDVVALEAAHAPPAPSLVGPGSVLGMVEVLSQGEPAQDLLLANIERAEEEGRAASDPLLAETRVQHRLQLGVRPEDVTQAASHDPADIRIAELGWRLAMSQASLEGGMELLHDRESASSGAVQLVSGCRRLYAETLHENGRELELGSLAENAELSSWLSARSTPTVGGSALPENAPEIGDSVSRLRACERMLRENSLGDAIDGLRSLREEYKEHPSWRRAMARCLFDSGDAEMEFLQEYGEPVELAERARQLGRADEELRARRLLMEKDSAEEDAWVRDELFHAMQRSGIDTYASEESLPILARVIETQEAGSLRSGLSLERGLLAETLGQLGALEDHQRACSDDDKCGTSLRRVEATMRSLGPTEELAKLEEVVAGFFAEDRKARAAFLVRAGETYQAIGQVQEALTQYRSALQIVPSFMPALVAWQDLAIAEQRWAEFADAAVTESQLVSQREAKAEMLLVAAIVREEVVGDPESAVELYEQAAKAAPLNDECFARLRSVYHERKDHRAVVALLLQRLQHEEDKGNRVKLGLEVAQQSRHIEGETGHAIEHFKAVLALQAQHPLALEGLADLCYETANWKDAAEALLQLARLKQSPAMELQTFLRLGSIYAEHLPEPQWAIRSYKRVVELDPNNIQALEALVDLGEDTQDYKLAVGASQRLIQLPVSIADRIRYLHRVADLFAGPLQEFQKAEKALHMAAELDPRDESVFEAIWNFYIGREDLQSARVHAGRFAGVARRELSKDPSQIDWYRCLARVEERVAGVSKESSAAVAQAALEMASLLSDGDPPVLLSPLPPGALADPKNDDILFGDTVPQGLRSLLAMLGDRLSKHLSIDLRRHGVTRNDRLRSGDARSDLVRQVSTSMGCEVELYLSRKDDRIVAAEGTSPATLILGRAHDTQDQQTLRFWVAGASLLARTRLASPRELGVERFGELLVALVRLCRPDFAPRSISSMSKVNAEEQRLRRLLPSNVLEEMAPFALSLATEDFDHRAIWQGISLAGYRAGVLVSGVGTAIRALMIRRGVGSLGEALQDPEIIRVIGFACGREHAEIRALLER